MNAGSILIVEDEPTIADTLLYAFQTDGFATTWRTTGAEARAAVAAAVGNQFDLIVLDVGLPDESGFDVCRAIRASFELPILFLTSRNSEIDRIVGLEIGADDYVTKPFSPREVTARVRAILRCTNHRPDIASAAADAGLVLDRERCEVRLDGTPLELTRYEFRLLAALASHPGRVFSREQLMEAAWEDPGASLDRTVDAHIKTLRAKIRAASEGRAQAVDPIRTHRGLGYSFVGD